ncbi:T9SS type A sorting domain-containing protein, partial [candidate division KSB1 bacterium]|nr:T9SS type A sorting domain-containing protein [candidate division KSB1 bacterium]
WIYNENTGGIITGGTISITPSTGVNIIQDGSGGFYQFTIAQAGTYILTYTPPAGFVPSALCPPQANPLDPNPTDPNPLVVGLGSRDGASMTMTNYNCGDNPYYMTLVLEPGDPVIINNNIPLTQQPIAVTLVSFTATAINNFVILTWQTGTEINHAGFNLYRSSRPEEGYEKMNPALIASRGNATGGYLYEYQDQPPQNGTWYYKLQDISTDGKSTLHAPVGVEYNAIPLSYALHQNHPNPFNPSTRIRYELPESGYVSIRVYDTGGRLVRTLVAEQKTAGVYFVTWDRSNESGMPVPSGIYFYRMTAGEFSQTRKMTVIK